MAVHGLTAQDVAAARPWGPGDFVLAAAVDALHQLVYAVRVGLGDRQAKLPDALPRPTLSRKATGPRRQSTPAEVAAFVRRRKGG